MKEAKKLKEAMDEIFPAMVAPIQITYRNEPYYVPNYPYQPYWTFTGQATDLQTTEGYGNSCTASLEISPEGNLIL